jgi:TPR repeat protein
MKHPLQLIGALCLCAAFWASCSGDNSDVEDSPSATSTLIQSEEAARKGDHNEMMNLGMTYYQGTEDVKQDNLMALIWLTLASEDEGLKIPRISWPRWRNWISL